ncbi:MAG TPA: TonB-dependent receptor [Chitinophagaceae bacterium]|nr:TonB-dependent receptor [Chitinophagaceae bacterium]
MLRAILLTASVLAVANSFSQSFTTGFRLVNRKKEPVPFATVTAVSYADSTRVRETTADSSGFAGMSLERGQYVLRVSAVNYLPLETRVTINGERSFEFSLEPLPRTLDEVVLTSRSPLMRQEDDKTIVEPENLVAASTNAYEVIEKIPGLFVDQDGNIYISSLSPAAVQINGRDLKMSAADMASLLKSLPPNAIERIEIVRTPSAKYEASSTGGVVNVVLRKGIKPGLTGSMQAGMQQGVYGNRFTGLSVNNNKGNRTSTLNLNYARRNSFEQIVSDRLFGTDSLLGQEAITTYPADSWFAGYSHVFPLNARWELDLSSSGSYNRYRNHTENRSSIGRRGNGQPGSRNLNLVDNDGSGFNLRAAAELTRKLDSTGSEWVKDVFYNYTNNESDQVFSSHFFQPRDTQSAGDGRYGNHRHLVVVRSDLKLHLKKRFTLETGVRVSWLDFRNDAHYFREVNGVREKDAGRTNRFRYEEQISSVYLQGSRTLAKDLVLKAGVRLENTDMKGNQVIPADTSFRVQRTDLFPYVYLSRKIMTVAKYELRAYLVFRRTISRPVYEQLNPFSRYVDEYLSEQGNPRLRPQFTTNWEANISVEERPILAVGINRSTDLFTNVVYQDDSVQRRAVRTYDNLGSSREWYLRGLGAIPPGRKYFFVLGAQYNHNYYDGQYEGQPLSYERGSWTVFTYHSLRLDRRSQFTMNGFVRFRGQQQFYELSTFGTLNASVNRQFFKQKLTVTLSATDIFRTNQNEFSIAQGSVNATGRRWADTRRFGLQLRYHFGMRKKEENNPLNIEEPANN